MKLHIPNNFLTNLFIAKNNEAQEKRRVKFNRIITPVLLIVLCGFISFSNILIATCATLAVLVAYKFVNWTSAAFESNEDAGFLAAICMFAFLVLWFFMTSDIIADESSSLWTITKGYVILAVIATAGFCIKHVYKAVKAIRKNYIENGLK